MGRKSRKRIHRDNWRANRHNQMSNTGEGHDDGEKETDVGTVVSAHWRRGQSLVSSSLNYLRNLLAALLLSAQDDTTTASNSTLGHIDDEPPPPAPEFIDRVMIFIGNDLTSGMEQRQAARKSLDETIVKNHAKRRLLEDKMTELSDKRAKLKDDSATSTSFLTAEKIKEVCDRITELRGQMATKEGQIATKEGQMTVLQDELRGQIATKDETERQMKLLLATKETLMTTQSNLRDELGKIDGEMIICAGKHKAIMQECDTSSNERHGIMLDDMRDLLEIWKKDKNQHSTLRVFLRNVQTREGSGF